MTRDREPGDIRPRLLAPRLFAVLTAPLVANVVIMVCGLPWGAYGEAWVWLAYFCGISGLIAAGATFGWPRLVSAASVVDVLLTRDNDERRVVAAQLTRYFGWRQQVAVAAMGICTGVAFLAGAQGSLAHQLPIGAASYLALATTGAFTMTGAYWATAFIWLAYTVQRTPSLQLRFLDPARTPEVMVLASPYTFGAPFAASGLALGEIPVLYAHSIAPGSSSVAVANVITPILALGMTFLYAVMPHYWLTRLIRREKRRSLSGLYDWIMVPAGARIEDVERAHAEPRSGEPVWPENSTIREWLRGAARSDIMALYSLVSAAPESTFPTGAWVQYSAAFLALAAPYAVRATLQVFGIA